MKEPTMAHKAHHHVNYLAIFGALCVLTLFSWGADEAKNRALVENRAFIAVVVLAIASAKALFVMMYFMHLKFEGQWKYVLLAPTVILAIGLPLALLPDIGVHYYDVHVPQEGLLIPVDDPAAVPDEDGGHALHREPAARL